MILTALDREEATKEDFSGDDGIEDGEHDEWDQADNWETPDEGEQDVTDENQAYLDFLNEEVGGLRLC